MSLHVGQYRKKQAGQALIYGIFVLTGGLAALFFLFNTGQLSSEKVKLVNTSDAVAYSAGVMHARALNFEAYTNRAMMANTVAIAQLVSLSSWSKYVSNLATFGAVAANPKFALFYPSYLAALAFGATETAIKFNTETSSDENNPGVLKYAAQASDTIIRDVLMKAQKIAYDELKQARQDVMDEVAQANYRNDGSVIVESLASDNDANDKVFENFVKRYSDNDRSRFAEAAKTAANKDGFVSKRSWSLPALWSDCPTALPRVDWLDRRGGTELLGLDEWKAMDTLSEKRWVPKDKEDLLCQGITEIPAGWGLQSAAQNSSTDLDPEHYDASLTVNPASSTLATGLSSTSWDYSGLPNFYDLSEDALKQDDPHLQFSVRLRRDKSQTMTSEGRSAIRSTERLNAYQSQPAGGSELVAISTSEVYFQREGDTQNNVYGQTLGKGREIGSLFNPYWQVRLIQSNASIKKGNSLQGANPP